MSIPAAGAQPSPEEVLRDPVALQEWADWCGLYGQGVFNHQSVPPPPRVISAAVAAQQARPPLLRIDSSALPSPPSYHKNESGRPETPGELLEHYLIHGHFAAPAKDVREARRTAVIRRYGLDTFKQQELINEIANVARCYFQQTVLVTVVLSDEVLLLGSASAEGDETDWSSALASMRPSYSLCRHSVLSNNGEVLVINDPAIDWRLRTHSLFKGQGGSVGATMNAPFSLPGAAGDDSIPVGGCCLMSTEDRKDRPFSQSDQDLLANLGKLAAREILRGFGESERARAEKQASFLSEYIGVEIVDSSSTVIAPSMDALRRQRDRIDPRLLSAVQTAVKQLVELTRADASLLLDLRDTIDSSKGSMRVLRPAVVLGSEGFPLTAGSSVADPERLAVIIEATEAWTSTSSISSLSTASFSFLLSAQSAASVVVPIFDHKGSLALVILLASSYSPIALESCDMTFARNVGQLSLSSLIKHHTVQIERAKLSFISMISHELRTPIHGLAGSLELLRLDDHDKAGTLAIANECVEALRSTVDEILLLGAVSGTSAQRQWIPEDTGEANLHDILFDIIKTTWVNGPLGSDVEVILDVAEREGPWAVHGHSAAFRRIAANLIQNACSFTRTGFIRVSLDTATTSEGASGVKLQVTDTGIGMDPHFLSSGLFEPFEKVDQFTHGPGLGMACVNHLVQLTDGSVHVDSVLGAGTNVEIVIPLTFSYSTPPCAHTVRVVSDELPSSTRFRPPTSDTPSPSLSEPVSFSFSTSSTSSSASSATSTLRKLRILAAEDNLIARNILKKLFSNKELYDLLAVEDGQQAVDAFCEWRPDVTLMDIQMPIKDGLAAAHEIRILELKHNWPRHRIIALTSLSNSVDRDQALAGPMDAWELKGGKSLKTIQAELATLQMGL